MGMSHAEDVMLGKVQVASLDTEIGKTLAKPPALRGRVVAGCKNGMGCVLFWSRWGLL